jgi:hypothetical protein
LSGGGFRGDKHFPHHDRFADGFATARDAEAEPDAEGREEDGDEYAVELGRACRSVCRRSSAARRRHATIYFHNTDDEFSHESFLKAYLESKGADVVDLSKFAHLPPSQVTGVPNIGRLTNLTQLTVDTSWWTRYRSDTKNPDLGDTFSNAIPTLAVGQHTAIPRSNSDLVADNSKPGGVSDHTQAIASTAGFHFAFIEQGGTSLYPQLAQRVTNLEVLRILLSIGPTETSHFQTWHDKAGNARQLTDIDKGFPGSTGAIVTFPNLNDPNATAAQADELQTNLIMPEPTFFLKKKFGPVSIIRPTETKGAAMAALNSLINDGLFIGHTSKTGKSDGFIELLRDLAEDADEARRESD